MGAAMSWFKKHLGRKRRPGPEHTVNSAPLPTQPKHELAPIAKKSLSDQLHLSKSTSDYPESRGREYFPEQTYELIQSDVVWQHWGREVRPELVRFVVEDAKRLFTIVAASFPKDINTQIRMMEWFLKKDIRDSGMSPQLNAKPGVQWRNYPWLDPEELRSRDSKMWDVSDASTVWDQQWKVLVPVFSIHQANYDLGVQTILPFLKVKGSRQAKGAFGTVNQVRIEKNHFLGHDASATDGKERYKWPETFAVKEITPPDDDERTKLENTFANEAENLRKMNKHYSNHIVRFATAFTIGDDEENRRYFLVFEWADGGSLENLFEAHPDPPLSKRLITSVIKQIEGLAKALQLTHDKAQIRHGDLKPGNILWFKTKERPQDGEEEDIIGTLKIGDWGLGKYHAVDTHMRGVDTVTKHGTAMYEPPEVHPDLPLGVGGKKVLSRQYDTWSMGCIVLEMIIWILYGLQGVKLFRDYVHNHKKTDRIPCYDVESVDGVFKAKVRPIVVEWMDHIAKEHLCKDGQALGALLRIVREDLLVVDLPKRSESFTSTTPEIHFTQQADFVPEAGKSDDQDPGLRVLVRAATARADDLFLGPKIVRATSSELVEKLLKQVIKGDNLEIDIGNSTPRLPNFGARGSTKDTSDRLTPGRRGSHHKVAQTPAPRIHVPQPDEPPVFQMSASPPSGGLSIPSPGRLSAQAPNVHLDREWETHIDNSFAQTVLSNIQPDQRRLPQPSPLCSDCQEFKFFDTMGFSVEYDAKDLELRAYKNCDLCTLFWKTVQRYSMDDRGVKIRFKKVQSWLRMDGVGSPVLSIYRSLDSTRRPIIQLGLPTLPTPGSPHHFAILRHWLQLCDQKNLHPNCHTRSTPSLPTRLLDVGTDPFSPTIHLWEPTPSSSSSSSAKIPEYIALSHPWGTGPHFVTNTTNLAQHKRGIEIARLPATFRDAVTTTRALGKRYLWIDSICIIQGPGGDFQSEATKMETVFSSAYCVLAATRAGNQSGGFLGTRPREREYVTLYEDSGKPFYICENLDNFDGDVLEGGLNKRGWVLQEHALARRTVFFAERQTYWECGDGVRCETMGKMSNNLAAFLGDPSFPRLIMNATQGEKIIRLQNLFKTYSTLAFTNPSDRPLAVDGIQSRLLRAFDTQGGFGIFGQDEDDSARNAGQKGLLRRSLLWVRAERKKGKGKGGVGMRGGDGGWLRKIEFGEGVRGVPSWSWMGYEGEVDFLRPGFGTVEWMELRSPWPGKRERKGGLLTSGERPGEDGRGGRAVIRGNIREITDMEVDEGIGKLVFDTDDGFEESDQVECLVLGVEKEQIDGDRRHYFIMLEPVDRGQNVYRRIGAGYLTGRHISKDGHEGEVI